MDPHHLQNSMNNLSGQHSQQPLMNQPFNQVNYEQYMTNMNNFQFYGINQMNVNQMLSMDPFLQQQQYQQMLMQSQQPNVFQQQTQALQPNLFSQQQLNQVQLQQQQQQQRFMGAQQPSVTQQQPLQHQSQQAAQSSQNHQQSQGSTNTLSAQQNRLLEEQARQFEIQRRAKAEQEAKEKEEKRRKDEELRKQQQELAILREKERLEQQRKLEEEARIRLEQARKEEQERREREKVLKVHDEMLRKQKEGEQAQKEMAERLGQLEQPISLVSTHFLTKYTHLIPFPCESMTRSKMASLCVNEMMQTLQDTNPALVSTISRLLAQVDVNDIRTRMDQMENVGETNDLPLSQMPPLINAVMEENCNALDVEPEHRLDENMLNEVVQEEMMDQQPARIITSCAHNTMPGPSTSTASQDQPIAEKENPKVVIEMEGGDALQLRRQMASVGKQPKANQQRKKRDMVESLFDSLTDYFDPSEGRRRRGRKPDDDSADPFQRDMEAIAAMEAAEQGRDPDHVLGEEGTSDGYVGGTKAGSEDDELKFYEKSSRKKRRKEEHAERPPTPTEIIHMRDAEWNERQRKKLEKRKRRKGDDSDGECWNHDVMAENDSLMRFSSIVDGVLEQVADVDLMQSVQDNEEEEEEDMDEDEAVSAELLIERSVLDDLRNETQKLKSWKKINKVPVERLVKLVTMLERNMRDVTSRDGSRLIIPVAFEDDGEEDDAALRELVDDRILRAADAACTALMIITSPKMPKQVFMEDAIERAISLCKLYLNYIIFPASDSLFRAGNKKQREETKRRRKAGTNARSGTSQHVYARVAEMLGCYAELARSDALSETSVHQLASMAVASFFVSNVGELQLQAMRLCSNIFTRADESIRVSILNDILNSLHRLPPGKNTNNSYRLGPDQWISNTTVLLMQLSQSIIKVPRKRRQEEDKSREFAPDTIVKDSWANAHKLTNLFLTGFLSKCSCKGNKTDGEEDYRRLFDAFLQDLLLALYKPEWPAAEMILTLLGALLVKLYRTKSTDMTIRQASLDYLGSITARLRRDVKTAVEDSDQRLQLVVKTLIFEEQEETQYETVDEVDISEMSMTDRLKKLEQALIDFLVGKKGDGDVSIEYAVIFYAGEWYKETAEDVEVAKLNFKQNKTNDLSEKERRKLEKRMERMQEKGLAMKEFLIKLVDRKQMRKRAEGIKRIGCVMMESDAAWAVKYLASRREFSHSFDIYLKHILYGVTAETTVSLRTKAMRCLTQIIEADHEVLGLNDVQQAVNSRMMDPNAAVREATIELLGKFLLVKQSFIPQYYGILCERIKDSGTAVRKRVIRIMREICERYPNYENIADMLSKLIRRVSDEDGVKKLVQETIAALWFQPVSERERLQLTKKVIMMTEVVQLCCSEQIVEFLEQVIQGMLKQGDKSVLLASKQIVDTLVDNVLSLESKMATDANEQSVKEEDLSAAVVHKKNQDRLLACLTTLSIFSKVRPELMVRHAETLQPYLSMSTSTKAEQQVLLEVISMLERVVPLMSHPSDAFLKSVDDSLAQVAVGCGLGLVVSAVSCASAVWSKFGRKQPAMAQKFLFFLKNLNRIKLNFETIKGYQLPPDKGPMLQRSVFTIGLMCRYFDFDVILENDQESMKFVERVTLPPNPDGEVDEEEEEKTPRVIRDNVFALLEFFSRSPAQPIRHKALTSIGHLCAQYAQYLARSEVKNIYMTVMKSTDTNFLQLKIQALQNLELFLQAEEKKMMKSNSEWEKSKEQQNLKDMELAHSGLGSAVIQIYWHSVLNAYFNSQETVRQSAVQVAWLTLSQGLVTPGSSIPTLIAMTTDPLPLIRNKVENLLKDIDSKYQGMVQSKAVAGIRIAYRLMSLIHASPNSNHPIRGIRECDLSATAATSNVRSSRDQHTGLPRYSNDCQAILNGLYQSLRNNRQQRRSFLNSVLRLFSEDSREKLPLDEWIFVADNIAMFPYQVMDEPLYAIRQIDGIIALSGQTIVNQFKAQLMPSLQPPQPHPGGHHALPPEDDDLLFEPDSLYRRFPEEKGPLYDLMLNSQACFILLYLKNYLVKLYGFTEAKVQEYSPSENAKVYEKAVTRRNVQTFCPQSALEELRPEVIEERQTVQGHYKLAVKICNFRKMLLSLDKMEGDDDDEEEQEVLRGSKEEDEDETEEAAENEEKVVRDADESDLDGKEPMSDVSTPMDTE